jgi:hypothetical protein
VFKWQWRDELSVGREREAEVETQRYTQKLLMSENLRVTVENPKEKNINAVGKL